GKYRKPSVFDASLITIGSWKREAQQRGDLVANFYFETKRLVWEILKRDSKIKLRLEIKWEHIVGMRVSLEENQHGILEIELSQPPMFFKATDPQRKKHTVWFSVPDFTDGQATLSCCHSLVFSPGALDEPFKRLVDCEPRFYNMCLNRFISPQTPMNITTIMPRAPVPVRVQVPVQRNQVPSQTTGLPYSNTLYMDSSFVTVTSENSHISPITSIPPYNIGGGAYYNHNINPLPQFPSGCNENQQLTYYSDFEAYGSTNVPSAPLIGTEEVPIVMNNTNYEQGETNGREKSEEKEI
ncbi:hypothetical protein PanWU01x14_238590, partial [Parasponia andersonii]